MFARKSWMTSALPEQLILPLQVRTWAFRMERGYAVIHTGFPSCVARFRLGCQSRCYSKSWVWTKQLELAKNIQQPTHPTHCNHNDQQTTITTTATMWRNSLLHSIRPGKASRKGQAKKQGAADGRLNPKKSHLPAGLLHVADDLQAAVI